RLLRQVGRLSEARQAWRDLGARNGPLSAIAWIELAKVMEHVDRDVEGALAAVAEAERLAQRAQTVGQPVPLVESDLARRRRRLERRQAGAATRSATRKRTRTKAGGSDPAALPSPLAHAVAYG